MLYVGLPAWLRWWSARRVWSIQGSGKTYTLSGGVGIDSRADEGIIPNAIKQLFALVAAHREQVPSETIEVVASAMEIYNEELRDLACPSTPSRNLQIREATKGQCEVSGLQEETCTCAEELQSFLDTCLVGRTTSSTKMNETSSRSHAVLTGADCGTQGSHSKACDVRVPSVGSGSSVRHIEVPISASDTAQRQAALAPLSAGTGEC
ncbi:hypothetical protein CYMTET_36331 [Cymbomonas tetramitiformis]|uniref:Kinesin motor domain-containing protein n=1 Tax=Cymbomonas tetramitiformis TaxID=36881 RepID=A0AAE0F7B6_9CHLO|nr:hypothetical protein CYMTET_36331 [Cymbomonas tetramitiformis]